MHRAVLKGYKVNSLGIETLLDVSTYSLAGRARKNVRLDAARAARVSSLSLHAHLSLSLHAHLSLSLHAHLSTAHLSTRQQQR